MIIQQSLTQPKICYIAQIRTASSDWRSFKPLRIQLSTKTIFAHQHSESLGKMLFTRNQIPLATHCRSPFTFKLTYPESFRIMMVPPTLWQIVQLRFSLFPPGFGNSPVGWFRFCVAKLHISHPCPWKDSRPEDNEVRKVLQTMLPVELLKVCIPQFWRKQWWNTWATKKTLSLSIILVV